MQLEHNQKQLRQKLQEMNTSSTDYKKDENQLKNLQKEIKMIETQLSKIQYDDQKFAELSQNRRRIDNEIYNLQSRVDSFEGRSPEVVFTYTDPEPGFNRKAVKGLVCNNFTMKDTSMALALETAAGSRVSLFYYSVFFFKDDSIGKIGDI